MSTRRTSSHDLAADAAALAGMADQPIEQDQAAGLAVLAAATTSAYTALSAAAADHQQADQLADLARLAALITTRAARAAAPAGGLPAADLTAALADLASALADLASGPGAARQAAGQQITAARQVLAEQGLMADLASGAWPAPPLAAPARARLGQPRQRA